MRLFTRNLLIACTLAAAALPAMADEISIPAHAFSYTYADARYFSTDSDAFSINQSGGALSGSYAIGQRFFVSGDALYGESKNFSSGTANGKFQTITATLRGGAHYPLTPILDVLANAGVLYGDVKGKGDYSSLKDNDTGYIAEAGLRIALIPKLEVAAYYDYQDLFKQSSTTFTAELQYHVTPHIAAIASAANGKSTDVYTVGGRYNF
jgi:opacity protein-like surface antigen